MHPHLPRDVRENLVSILELHPKHRVGQWFDDRPFNLNWLFFRHKTYRYSFSFEGVIRPCLLTKPEAGEREGGIVYMFDMAKSSRGGQNARRPTISTIGDPLLGDPPGLANRVPDPLFDLGGASLAVDVQQLATLVIERDER